MLAPTLLALGSARLRLWADRTTLCAVLASILLALGSARLRLWADRTTLCPVPRASSTPTRTTAKSERGAEPRFQADRLPYKKSFIVFQDWSPFYPARKRAPDFGGAAYEGERPKAVAGA